MAMTLLPDAPTRADPSNFSAKGDALMTALPTFVTEANALEVNVDAKAVQVAADRVQTGLDAVATAADRVQTALDRIATGDDAATTAANLASVATIFDNFDDRYLGAKASDPTLDNDGNALSAGVVYWNTTSSSLRFYNGAAWEAPSTQAATSAANALTSENNAAASLAATNQDTIDTAADRVQTGLDAVATAGDRVQTGLDVLASADSASAASTSESTTAGYLSATQAARDATLAALDSFDDRYLGEYSVDPTLDNDGLALVSGALYFNPTFGADGSMKVYNGTIWLAAYASLSGALVASANLSDLINVITARANLGLGTAATTAATAYATASQGTKADSALQAAAIGVTVAAYDDSGVTDLGTTGGAVNLDLSLKKDPVFKITLNAATTFTFTNIPASGTAKTATIFVTQDATGGRTVAFAAAKYDGGAQPPATTTTLALDIWSMMVIDGTNPRVSLSQKDSK